MKNKMKVIALTGGIATGKSTVAQMFFELSVPTISADEIAHIALQPKSRTWNALFERYGKKIMLNDSIIDHDALAKIIFEDHHEKKYVESIIHPFVKDEIAHRIAKLAKEGHAYAIVEVPLLFEVGWEKEFDAVVVVACSEGQEILRCTKKFNLSADEAIKRISAQKPLSYKVARADAVIENDSSLEETRLTVRRLHDSIVAGRFPESK